MCIFYHKSFFMSLDTGKETNYIDKDSEIFNCGAFIQFGKDCSSASLKDPSKIETCILILLCCNAQAKPSH